MSHLASRAREVRETVANMFYNGLIEGGESRHAIAWSRAKAAGWRVVPVIVTRRSEWLADRKWREAWGMKA